MKKPRTGAVLVTGASTGIGYSCVTYLAERGYRVFAGVRKPADAEALERESERISAVILEITDAESIAAAGATIEAALGDEPLAGVVNNAGIGIGGPLEFLDLDALRRQLEVNVIGTLAVSQRFIGLLRRHGGRIVNISSIAGRVAMGFMGPYAASKHALEALSDSLRRELAPWGVHVCTVTPGAIKTPIWDKAQREIDRIVESLPPRGRELYSETVSVFCQRFMRQAEVATPAQTVAKTVLRALHARWPKTRYVVGKDAFLIFWLQSLLGDRALDFGFKQLVKQP